MRTAPLTEVCSVSADGGGGKLASALTEDASDAVVDPASLDKSAADAAAAAKAKSKGKGNQSKVYEMQASELCIRKVRRKE